MIVPRVFKSRQRKRKNISIVLSSQNPSEINDFRGIFLFFVYCGANTEVVILNISFRQAQT